MFRECDRRFAQALGIPFDDDECEVESLVARTWWDDYALDRPDGR